MMRSWKRLLPAGAAWLVLAASAEAQQPDLPAWVAVDSAARSVELRLPASGDTTATLNGHHHGSAQLVVPFGWTVKWEWTNRDSTLRHSLVVMAEREKIPPEGGRPAIDNAMTLVRERAQRHGITLGCEVESTLDAIVADERKFKQILLNLL